MNLYKGTVLTTQLHILIFTTKFLWLFVILNNVFHQMMSFKMASRFCEILQYFECLKTMASPQYSYTVVFLQTKVFCNLQFHIYIERYEYIYRKTTDFYTVSTMMFLSSVIIWYTMNTSQGHYANIITVWRGLIINVS